MTFPATVSGSVAIDATDVWPRLHADHGDGRWSLALTPESERFPIYIRGTHSELLDLAAKIVASVPATESVPVGSAPLPGAIRQDGERWLTADGWVDALTGSPKCNDCNATMTHDQGPYWFCDRWQCSAYRHTILFADNKRSDVGIIR